jgi:hypothetical protein
MRGIGLVKYWHSDGSISIWRQNDGQKTEAKKYELQADGTHTLYHVKYDDGGDEESCELKS